MPTAIIRDPKMNNQSGYHERRFGVLYSDNNGYLGYDKRDDNELRFITSGTMVHFDGSDPMSSNEQFPWDGITITKKAVKVTIDVEQGPIVKKLNEHAKVILPNDPPLW